MNGAASRDEQTAFEAAVRARAWQRVRGSGYMDLSDLVARVAEDFGGRVEAASVARVAKAMPGFEWLDNGESRFWFGDQGGNSVARELRKVLATGRVVEAVEVREALRRACGRDVATVPASVVLEMCARVGGCETRGRSIVPTQGGAGDEYGVFERWLLGFLGERGRPATAREVSSGAKAMGFEAEAVHRAAEGSSIVVGDSRSGFRLVGKAPTGGKERPRPTPLDRVAQEARAVAERLVARSGYGELREVQERVEERCLGAPASVIELGVGSMEGVRWLCRLHGWFWFGQEGNALVGALEDVLVPGTELELEGLREMLLRRPEFVGEEARLRVEVLFRVCSSLEGVIVEGAVARRRVGTMACGEAGIEEWVRHLFERRGPRLSWREMEAEARLDGKRPTDIIDAIGAVLRRDDSGVYVLAGAEDAARS